MDVHAAKHRAHHVPSERARLRREVRAHEVRPNRHRAREADAVAVEVEITLIAVVAIEHDKEGEQPHRDGRVFQSSGVLPPPSAMPSA